MPASRGSDLGGRAFLITCWTRSERRSQLTYITELDLDVPEGTARSGYDERHQLQPVFVPQSRQV